MMPEPPPDGRISDPEREEQIKDTARAEAFSDGVIAIAITLLAFQITVPTLEESRASGGLLAALLHNWPDYLAYGTSFLVILIMWVNHHRLFKLFRRVDHNLLMLNGLLLMLIALVPFTTTLLADYLREPDANIAAALYALLGLLIAFAYQGVWRYARYRRRLILPRVSDAALDAINKQFRIGPVVYLIAVVVSLINAYAGIAVVALTAIWFALPSRQSDNVHV